MVDGLKGFPEAITAVFPLTSVQTCIVHLSRYCLSFCGWKEGQAPGSRTEGQIPGRNRRGGPQAAHRVRSRPLGQKVSDDCRELAPQLGTDRSLLRFSPITPRLGGELMDADAPWRNRSHPKKNQTDPKHKTLDTSRPTHSRRLQWLIELVNQRPKLLLSSHVNLVDPEGEQPRSSSAAQARRRPAISRNDTRRPTKR